MLKLSSAARIVVRPGPALQFGVDATRAGVIDTIAPHHIGPVIKTLTGARTPQTKTDLVDALVSAGLSFEASSSLVEDLLVFGILRRLPAKEPRVAILGRGALTATLSDLLAHSGCTVRRPLRGETDARFLRTLSPEIPLVAVDKLAHSRTLAPAVRNGRRRLFVPTALIDGHGLIGPLATAVAGPCPICTDLHRIDVDPEWPHVLTQLPAAPSAVAPVTVAATAAQAAAVVLAFLGLEAPTLGAPGRASKPGLAIQVDPFSYTQEFHVSTHDGCPLCFEVQHLKQGFSEVLHLDRADA